MCCEAFHQFPFKATQDKLAVVCKHALPSFVMTQGGVRSATFSCRC